MNLWPSSTASKARLRHRIAALTAALVPALAFAVSGTAPAATAAQAVSSSPSIALPSCPTSTLCTFASNSYGGTRWNFPYASYPHNVWIYVGSAANDNITSLYNNRTWVSWLDKDCPASQYSYPVQGQQSIANLNNGSWFWDQSNGSIGMNDSTSAFALQESTTVAPGSDSC